MDFLDFSNLFPIVPPTMPGERASELTSGQRFGAGIGSTLLPTINFLLVLFAGVTSAVMALAVMPLASATLAFLVSRRLATPLAWAVVIAMGCAAFCLIGNSCALVLHAMAQFFHDF